MEHSENGTSWHFPRTELAKSYLTQLDSGLNSIAIFAERRKGKTEFLLEDLAPAAKAAGYTVVYINFWEQKSDPIRCITRGILRTLQQDSASTFSRWKKELSVNVLGVQAKVAAEPKNSPQALGDALDLLLEQKSNVLMMFDEIQQLAVSKDNDELIGTLRTFLDTHKRRVQAVFTGSSQDRLNKLFRVQKAAFYRGASLVEFPDMNNNFVDHLIARFQYISKRQLVARQAYKIFEKHNKSPFIIVDVLQTMLRDGIFDIRKGYEYYVKNNDPLNEYREIWGSLTLIDQLLLKEIILNLKPLYHETTYALLSEIMGVDNVGRGAVQHSIKRLREQSILNNVGHGQWEIESKEFQVFIESL